jgi:hypothetical protein
MWQRAGDPWFIRNFYLIVRTYLMDIYTYVGTLQRKLRRASEI